MIFEHGKCPVCNSDLEIFNTIFVNGDYDGYLELKCTSDECDCELDYDI